ncbi:MAG: hypothetical protein ACHREM_18785, partial [Polyangiales bacterium]
MRSARAWICIGSSVVGVLLPACKASNDTPSPTTSTSPDASTSTSASAHPLSPSEIALRHKLGIPDAAAHVAIFSQSSHLDIDWQRTFDDYYTAFVDTAFTSANQVLQSQPRAFYSVAEMAYLQHHLSVHPEQLAQIRSEVASGQYRVVGAGMTSPDTLLPEGEMLARDYLFGL